MRLMLKMHNKENMFILKSHFPLQDANLKRQENIFSANKIKYDFSRIT